MKLRIFAVCTLLLGLTACASFYPYRGEITLPKTMPLLNLQAPNSSVEFTVHVEVPEGGDGYVLGIRVPNESHTSSNGDYFYHPDAVINNPNVRLEAHVFNVEDNFEQPLFVSTYSGFVDNQYIYDLKPLVNPGLLQSESSGHQVFKGHEIDMVSLVAARFRLVKSGDYRVQFINRSGNVAYFTDTLPYFELEYFGK